MDETVLTLCYHCNQPIADNMQVSAKIKIFENKKQVYRQREFHLDCLCEYKKTMDSESDRKTEDSDWIKLGNLFKEILGIPVYREGDKFAILRLLGLRVGKFIPNGQNVRGVKKGYPFDVIYNTMIYSRPAMEKALKDVSFNNMQSKVNYLMTILVSNINFIEGRMIAAQKTENALKNVDIENQLNVQTADYTSKADAENEVAKLLQSETKDDSDGDYYEDLFK